MTEDERDEIITPFIKNNEKLKSEIRSLESSIITIASSIYDVFNNHADLPEEFKKKLILNALHSAGVDIKSTQDIPGLVSTEPEISIFGNIVQNEKLIKDIDMERN